MLRGFPGPHGIVGDGSKVIYIILVTSSTTAVDPVAADVTCFNLKRRPYAVEALRAGLPPINQHDLAAASIYAFLHHGQQHITHVYMRRDSFEGIIPKAFEVEASRAEPGALYEGSTRARTSR